MRARAQSLAVLLALLATQGASASEDSSRSAPPGCPVLRVTPAHERAVEHALRARADVWGNALLRTRGGPTYAGVHRYASPLLFARTAHGKALTESGVYYVPFMQPSESGANVAVALHLADGSQIISNRVGGRGSRSGWEGAAANDSELASLAPHPHACSAATSRCSRRAASTRSGFAIGRSRSPPASQGPPHL
jgi:hypothetical protein